MDQNSEFGQMMQQAAAIKSEQVKQDRRKFEKAPQFIQHTLFHCAKPEIVKVRENPDVEERLEVAQGFRAEGNEFFKNKQYLDANNSYEYALGCFWYIKTTEPNFKEKGIKDEYLSFHDDFDDNEEVIAFKAACIGNIAACQLSMEMWDLCIFACNVTLELDPRNVKALYRRCQARTLPFSCGTVELEQAVKDLSLALKIEPDSKPMRKRYKELVKTKTKQKQVDKKTFTGLFNRGEIVSDKENTSSSNKQADEKAGHKKLEKEIEFFEDLSHKMKQQGREEDAAAIDKALESQKVTLDKAKVKDENGLFDPNNITPAMIKDAKENHGLDLTDPVVLEELRKLGQVSGAQKGGTFLDETQSTVNNFISDNLILISFVVCISLAWNFIV